MWSMLVHLKTKNRAIKYFDKSPQNQFSDYLTAWTAYWCIKAKTWAVFKKSFMFCFIKDFFYGTHFVLGKMFADYWYKNYKLK